MQPAPTRRATFRASRTAGVGERGVDVVGAAIGQDRAQAGFLLVHGGQQVVAKQQAACECHEMALVLDVAAVTGKVEQERLVFVGVQLLVIVQHRFGRDLVAGEVVDGDAVLEALLVRHVFDEQPHVVAVQAPGGAHLVVGVQHQQDADLGRFALGLGQCRGWGEQQSQHHHGQAELQSLPACRFHGVNPWMGSQSGKSEAWGIIASGPWLVGKRNAGSAGSQSH